jgi:hypothetical protein
MAGPAILKIEILSDSKPAQAGLQATDDAARDAARGVEQLGDAFDDTARRSQNLDAARDSIDNVGGASGKTATGLSDLAGAFELAGAEGFAEKMGTAGTVMDAAAGAADLYVVATQFLNVENLKAIGTFVAKTTATVAGTIATTAVTVATTAWTVAQWLLNAALNANPIGLVVLAVLVLIGVVVLIVKHWDTVKEVSISVWNAVKDAVVGAWNWIKENVFDKVGAVVQGYIDTFKKIWDTVREVWDSIKNALADNPITGMVEKSIEKIKEIIEWFKKLKVPEWITDLNPFSTTTGSDSTRVFRLIGADPGRSGAADAHLSADAGIARVIDRLIKPVTVVNVYLDGERVGGYIDRIVETRFDTEGAQLAAHSWG